MIENNKIKQNDYKAYISGLKGFACLMVMIGHYLGLYKYAESFPADSVVLKWFDTLVDSKVGFVLDESYWVILFFVVSGYLAANSKIQTMKDFVSKILFRFLRLGTPVFVAFVIIFVIYKAIGFHTTETDYIFENSFIQQSLNGNYSFWEVVLSPVKVLFMGKSLLNNPYWCLRDMFFTSVLIYFLLWLKEKTKNENVFLLAYFVVFIISALEFEVIYAGLFGMMVAVLEKKSDKSLLENKYFVLFLLVLCAMMRIVSRQRLSCMFFAALILLLPKLPLLNNIFSSRLTQFISKISFGIYSFHWPILCSIGMLILMKIYQNIGLLKACIVSASICIVITVLISIIYYYCIEKHIYVGLKKLEKGWKKGNG